MTNLHRPIRAEVLNKLRSSIINQGNPEFHYSRIISDLAQKLVLIDSPAERKRLINSWYQDLEGARIISKYHLSYQNPEQTKKLNVALSDLTIRYKKRFHNYFS